MSAAGPRRILYVQHTADLYGASRALLHLLEALDRSHYTPLVALPGPGPLADHLRALEVGVIQAPYLQTLWGHIFRSWRMLPFAARQLPAALALRREIQRHNIALVHSNVWTMLTGAAGARLAGVPHLWHVREVLPRTGGLRSGLARLTLANSARVVCVSQAVAAQFAGRRGAERVAVVYDGLPLGPRRPAAPPRDRLCVGLVGRLHPQKGQADLLRAFALLPPDLRARCRIKLVGGVSPGQEQHQVELQSLAQALGIACEVEVCGFVEQAQALIGSFDLLVLPATRAEGLGGVLLEAMAAQVPVLASAVGGTPEVITDGVDGVLVPPRDPPALARALERLLRDPQLRARLAQAGRATAERRFAAPVMADQIAGIYAQILGAPR